MAEPFVGPQEPALSHDDYQQLYAMLTSTDESQRKQAQGLTAKLTPQEEQEFFAFQRGTNKADVNQRTDDSFLGMPPEMAVAGGIGVGGAMAAKGLSAAGKVGAGAKALASLGVGVVKYDVAKSVLESAGLPSPLSDMAAMAIAGYRRGGKAAAGSPQVAESAAAETSPHLDLSRRIQAGELTPQQIGERLAAAKASGVRVPMPERITNPVAPTRVPLPERPPAPPPVPSAPRPVTQTGTSWQPAQMPQPVARPVAVPSAPVEAPIAPPAPVVAPAAAAPAVEAPAVRLSPQQALNELALAARRAKTTLSPADYDALKLVVADGTSPADAVAALVRARMSPAEALKASPSFSALPTDAERLFPPNKSGLPSRAPRATKR